MNFKVIIGVFLGLVPINSLGYIYELNVMRKWDGERNKYHYFLGFSDFHDKSHSANGKQLDLIKRLLAKADKNATVVVVEDLCSASAGRKASCGNFFVNPRGGILSKLNQMGSDAKLDVANIEYRYCRVTSLAPALNHYKDDLDKFASVRGIKVSALMDEISNMINELQKQQTSGVPAVRQIYAQNINDVTAALKELKFKKFGQASVAQYLKANSNPSNRLELIKRLLTFDSTLLDMKIINQVVQLDDKDKALVFAGGAHIARVAELLGKMGFEEVKKVTVAFNREYDLNRCLGSNIVEGKFCMRPEPLPAKAFELEE